VKKNTSPKLGVHATLSQQKILQAAAGNISTLGSAKHLTSETQ